MYQAESSAALLKKDYSLPRSRFTWANVGSTVVLLGLTSLLTDISSEMISAILPLYLLSLRVSPFQLGVADGIYQGAAALVRVLSGIASDRWRRPKDVAAAGYAFSAISRIGLLAGGGSLGPIFGSIVLDRIGKGIRTAPRDAMIAATSAAESRATAFGVHRAMDTAGAMIGPLLAFAILAATGQRFDAIFVVSSCVAILGVAVIVLFVQNPAGPPASAQPEVSLARIAQLFRHSGFSAVVVAGTALALMTVSDGLLYLALQQRMSIGLSLFPLLFVVTAVAFMALAIPAGRLADRIGHKATFMMGYALLPIVYGMLLLPRLDYVTAVSILIVLGAYYAATDGVLMALASTMLPPDLRASGLALLATGIAIGRLLASALYGALWTWLGVRPALVIFAIGLVVALTLTHRTVFRVARL